MLVAAVVVSSSLPDIVMRLMAASFVVATAAHLQCLLLLYVVEIIRDTMVGSCQGIIFMLMFEEQHKLAKSMVNGAVYNRIMSGWYACLAKSVKLHDELPTAWPPNSRNSCHAVPQVKDNAAGTLFCCVPSCAFVICNSTE